MLSDTVVLKTFYVACHVDGPAPATLIPRQASTVLRQAHPTGQLFFLKVSARVGKNRCKNQRNGTAKNYLVTDMNDTNGGNRGKNRRYLWPTAYPGKRRG